LNRVTNYFPVISTGTGIINLGMFVAYLNFVEVGIYEKRIIDNYSE